MFDLNQASEGSKSSNYQTPGIFDNVKVTDVVIEKSPVKGSSYLKLVTEGEDGAVGSSTKMYLSTTPSQGKTISAWAVTARNIIDLFKATHNVDEEGAKQVIDLTKVTSEEQLRDKLSAALVGRPFRAMFRGEKTSKGNTYAILGKAESMRVPKTESKLRFNPETDIKPYVGSVNNNSYTPSSVENDDPFATTSAV